MNELKYHGVDHTIAQFVDEFSADLPTIVLVTTGSEGCGDEIHCISADEIYWISGFQRQKRVVVKEVTTDKTAVTSSKYLSIPVDYPARFHRVDDRKGKKPGLAKSMAEVVEEMNVRPAPHLIAFENNANVSFSISGTKSRFATVGLMEIIATYHQKYLVGHPISDNTMYAVNLAIPVYMDITMDVAMGINGRSRQTFQEWMMAVSDLGRSYKATEAEMNPDIVQFGEIPDGGHYEYMQPRKVLMRNDNSNSNNNNKKNSYTQLTPPAVDNPYGNPYGKPYGNPNSNPNGVPEVPPRRASSYTTETSPPRPPSRKGSVEVRQSSRPLPRNPEKKRLPPIRPASPTLLSVRDIKFASQIPEDVDLRGLSTEDVSHCLCLLGMWRHAVDMTERFVDGEMLVRLDRDILVNEFKFSEFDAVQLVKFVGGWRPKQI